MSIKLTCDSPADIPKDLRERLGCDEVPLHIILGNDCFNDGVNVTPEDIYAYNDKTGDVPKTSAVSVAEYEAFFEKNTENGEGIIHFCISSGISSTYQNALIAAESFDNVFVIDTKSLTTGIALLMLKTREMIRSGMSAREAAAQTELLIPRVGTTFIVSSLEFLCKGGRCSSAAAFGANVLGIKPSVRANADGILTVDKKYRGKTEVCISKYIDDLLYENKNNIDPFCAALVRTDGISDEVMKSAESKILSAVPFNDIIFAEAGCTITSHCGKGTFSFMFMTK